MIDPLYHHTANNKDILQYQIKYKDVDNYMLYNVQEKLKM